MFRYLSFLILFFSSTLLAKPITLTVYSYDSFLSEWGPGAFIKAGFEAQCDCQVNIVSVGDGVSLLNRLKLEGSKSPADVVIGLDNNLVAQAKAAQLFQPHQLVPPEKRRLDWWDSEFIPYDYGYFAFIYNSERITTPPRNFTELLAADRPYKIVYQDPRTSTPGLGLLLWLKAIYGDKVSPIWQQLATKTVTVSKGWSEAYSLFLKGEADFVLSYSTSPAVHIMTEHDHRYKAALFDEGHYRQIELAAISRYSQQVALAQRFLAYLLTPDVQAQLVEKNIMYPVVDIPLPEAYQTLITIEHPLSLPDESVTGRQRQWIDEWLAAVSH